MKKKALLAVKKSPLHILFWSIVWIFFFVFFSVGSSNNNFLFWFSSLLSVFTIVATYAFIYNLIPNYLISKKYRLFTLYTFYTSVFVVFAVLMTVVFGFVFFFNLEYQQMPELTKNPGVILVCVLLIVALVSSFKILKINYKSLEEKKNLENKILQTQLQLKDQELMYLKQQIHPHFLFNTLNTIYGFALKKSNQTPDLILKMSNLLDYILYQVDKPLVLLQEELNHISDYISLEKSRFQESLDINFSIDDFDDNLQIAPMLFLPFVENAFKHGTQIDEVLSVKINLTINDQFLCFEIENSTNNNTNSNSGIGLENIKKRLEMLFDKNYALHIKHNDNKFKVNLEIPI